jgi:hypothetical protein
MTRRGRRRRSSLGEAREGASGGTKGARTEFPRSRDETVFHKKVLKRVARAFEWEAMRVDRPKYAAADILDAKGHFFRRSDFSVYVFAIRFLP